MCSSVSRAFVAIGREAKVHPARAARELPRQVERLGRIAARDGAARVALELIPTSELQVALDGEEPAGESLRRRDRVPQVVDRRVVDADRDADERRLAQVLAVLHATKLCSEHVSHVPSSRFAARRISSTD